jgi:CHAT domain-containing protein
VSALSLTDQARTAWTEYLKRDSVSPWAAEARARLEELARPTPAAAWAAIEAQLEQSIDAASADAAVRAQTTEARNFIENELLVDWANAVLAGNSGAAELDRARVMAEAMLRVAGESLYVDAVGAIDQAAVRGPAYLRDLAEAHSTFAAASAVFADDRFNESASAFDRARAQFGKTGSPFAILASIGQGAIAYVSGRGKEAETILRDTLRASRLRRYVFAEGRSTWFLGLIAMAQGRVGEAQAHYEETLATFVRVGDVEQAGAAHGLLAALHDYLGDSVVAWEHRLVAFQSLSLSRSLRFKYSLLASAVPSMRFESPETALSTQDAALAVAREWNRDGAIADALAQRASILWSLNRRAEADASIYEARQHLIRVPDDAFRHRVEVNILSTESDLFRAKNPSLAAAAAARAIDLVEQRRDRLRIAQLSLRLAQANIVSGRLADANAALARGIEAFEEERARSTEDRPISALDESWKLFETSVQLSLKREDYDRAFALSERARLRTTSESRQATFLHLSAVQASLVEDEAIVALTQFEDELAVWVIRRTGTHVVHRPLSRSDARLIIARHQNEILRELSRTVAGRDLYNEIVRPVSGYLAGASRLIFVPDSDFENVAFAAMWNSATGRYVVEETTLRMATSVGTYLAAGARQANRTADGSALIFSGANGNAAQLDAIAAAYRDSVVVAGPNATRDSFFRDASIRPILHLTAHTSTNRNYPLLSRVTVTDNPGVRHSGTILAREIAQRPLLKTGLVVLDELETVYTNRGEGTSSLMRAFLTAGVPAVIGTLPGADENTVRDLMIGFHREMSKGVSAEEALSKVQRNALQQNGRRIGAWTALVLYGSDR